MKTAMQELIDNLDGTLVKSIFQRLETDGLFIKALKKEKEQIIYDYMNGKYYHQYEDITAEEYYNQTYNN